MLTVIGNVSAKCLFNSFNCLFIYSLECYSKSQWKDDVVSHWAHAPIKSVVTVGMAIMVSTHSKNVILE